MFTGVPADGKATVRGSGRKIGERMIYVNFNNMNRKIGTEINGSFIQVFVDIYTVIVKVSEQMGTSPENVIEALKIAIETSKTKADIGSEAFKHLLRVPIWKEVEVNDIRKHG